MNTIKKVNLAEKFSLIHEYRSQKLVGELNGQHVKLVKLNEPFVWHHHDHEDELFLVVKGQLIMELRTGNIEVNPGEFLIVPRGVEHRPVAVAEVQVLLFEPAATVNTGNIRNELTRDTETIEE